jgi:peptidoglycan hydrolase CwlO-like protein
MVAANEDPITTLAVAIGRLEEGQKHLTETVGGMDKKLDAALADLSELKSDQAVTRRDVDELQDWRKSAEARKPPWTAIAAVTVAAATAVKTFLFP